MAEFIENDNKHDIINTEALRKKEHKREGYSFISDRRFKQLTANVRKKGAVILRGGEDIEEYLDLRKADALTIEKVMMFRQQVTLSEVLEEIHHFEQNLEGLNEDKDAILRGILNEIDAKEFLIKNAKTFRIPRKETRETMMQLNMYYRMLEEWREAHNV
ncbi:MAG: hypothetical protein IK111_08375 [Lachnospiraceae bacterium]|nr:hypothetical protein [Lachnospiraceae bacterium]